jgi:hypothetical protein
MKSKAKAKFRPTCIEEDCIVYDAQLNRGVPWVPPALYDDAEARAAKVGRKIADCHGDFQYVRLYFDTPITEDEAVLLEAP